MFLKPLDEPLEDEEGDAPELLRVWKHEQAGWTCVKTVPDTGAEASVCPAEMASGYTVQETRASREGREFTSASGDPLKNLGELRVPMQPDEGHWSGQRWQVAEGLTRPLLSVTQECDQGNIVVFGPSGGAILAIDGSSVRHFQRVGGTYELEMWLPPADLMRKIASSSGFPRPGM